MLQPILLRAPGDPLLFSAFALLTVGAPEAVGPPPEPSAIKGGEVDHEDRYPSVLAIQLPEQRCSGIAVASDVILTAAHCVDDLGFGQAITVQPGVEASYEDRLQGIEWGVHPEYCHDCRHNAFDFGYIRTFQTLALEADDFVAPIDRRDDWVAAVEQGAMVDVVGYGIDGSSQPDDAPRLRRHLAVDVHEVFLGNLEFDVDGDGSGPCEGDSGGPAFMRRDDGRLVWVGIDSRSFGCGERSTFGASHASLCWLREDAGVNLLPPGCESCDCVGPVQGCSCTTQHGGAPATLVVVLLAGLGVARRRRQPTASRYSPSDARSSSGSATVLPSR